MSRRSRRKDKSLSPPLEPVAGNGLRLHIVISSDASADSADNYK